MIPTCSCIWPSRRKTPKFSSIDEPSSSRIFHGRSPPPFVRASSVSSSDCASATADSGTSAWSTSSAASAAACPARRPKVIVSISELPPRRLAPCTETHATSPAAYSPASSVAPSASVATPPMW